MARQFCIAAAQYPIDWLEGVSQWRAKFDRWVEEAVKADAALLVFPEYGSMELASLFGKATAGDLHGSIAAMNDVLPEVDAAHADAASRHGVHIVAASFPLRGADGRFRNVARIFAPNGKMGAQEKLMMTRFERDDWQIAAGGPALVFDTALGRIGISICYDVEFPLIARAQAQAGAELILAPSCTELLAGYWRVRLGGHARAVENQCYVMHSPTVGKAPWSPAVEASRGAAGIYCPPDHGFPETGLVALGEMDKAQWVCHSIDLDKVAQVRADGGVLNYSHWGEQGTAPIAAASVVSLL